MQLDILDHIETQNKQNLSKAKVTNGEQQIIDFVRESINVVKHSSSIKSDLSNAPDRDKICMDIDKKLYTDSYKYIEDEGVKMNSSCCSSESSSSLASSMMSSESHHNVNDVMSQSNSSNDIIDEEIEYEDDIEDGMMKVHLNGKLDNVAINSNRDMILNLVSMNTNAAKMNKETVTTPNNNTPLSFVPSSTRAEEGMAGSANPTSTPASMTSGGNATCTFSRTFPNCGTYFFRHVSSAEEDEDEDDIVDNDTLSTSLLSSSSPTPRPIMDDEGYQNGSHIITSSPLKSDSDSHLPDFDLDEDDEDLDLASVLDRDTLFSAGLNVSDDLNITDGNGRLVPILDFSYINNEDVDLEAIIDSPESSRRKSDIKKLVGDAEKLLFQTVSFTSDESEFEQDEEISSSEVESNDGTASANELTCYQSASRKNSVITSQLNHSSELNQDDCQNANSSSGYKRSHSFHNYHGSGKHESENGPKTNETSIVIRRKHKSKGNRPTSISSENKSFCSKVRKNSNVQNTINVNNNNDYGCDASGEGK